MQDRYIEALRREATITATAEDGLAALCRHGTVAPSEES